MQRLASSARLATRHLLPQHLPTCRPQLHFLRPARLTRSVQVRAYAPTANTAVKIVIQGRKLPVTDSMKRYIEDKIQRAVNHFAHTVKDVHVTLSARGGDTGTKGPKQQKVDVTIFTLRHGVVRVEDVEGDMYASIDLVCDKVERKLRKVKERAMAKGTWAGRAGPHIDVAGEQQKEYNEAIVYETSVFNEEEQAAREAAMMEDLQQKYPPAIVRSKELKLEAMTAEEAVEQLEQLGHDFYVFREKGSDAIQVLYKRREAGYGLLVPKNAA